jgi:hypothetical protein
MHVSFVQIEDERFLDLLVFLNERVSDVLPSSNNTIRNWVMGIECSMKKTKKKRRLQNGYTAEPDRARCSTHYEASLYPSSLGGNGGPVCLDGRGGEYRGTWKRGS